MAESIIHVIRSLEPGAKVKLIEVDCTEFNGDIMRFHNYNVPYTPEELAAFSPNEDIPPKSIFWQGEEYKCWPYELSGTDLDGTGSSPTPSLSVANITGAISRLCLVYQNLYSAKVTEHITFEQYLDGGSDADPDMEFVQIWYITRKSDESQTNVSFDLSSPADVSGQQIPKRLIHSMCHWALNGGYRGPDCGYTGTAYFTNKDEPTTDPSKDECSGLCNGCKIRFGADQPLPFGGFIASSLITR